MNRFVALARTGLLGFATSAIVIATGCGIDVGVGGSTGTGGGPDGSGGSCSGPGSTVTVGAGGQPGSTSSVSTGTGSNPVKCGGLTPFPQPPCAADEYCDYSINNCGAFDNQGVCTKRPEACDKNLYPTCGCDGQIHSNECDAAMAGTDVNTNGCMPPPGQFSCGAHFCLLQTEYCEHEQSDVVGIPDTFTCKPLPAGCGATPSCACLSGVACGGDCAEGNNGGQIVTCKGG